MINSTSAIALSGMQVAQLQLGASANNVANVNTTDFKRQAVRNSPLADGGVSATVKQAEQAGPALEQDLISQLAAKNAFLANLAVFKTQDKLAGALLSARA